MSDANTFFTVGSGGSYDISGIGGANNLNYTLHYGGYNGDVSINSNMKSVFYTANPREKTVLEEAATYLTNKSSYVGGISQETKNLSIEFVGDRYYQDAEAAKAFKKSISEHEAQLSSPGHNDFGLDLTKMLKNLIPLDLKPIAEAVSSVSATPDDLEPMPPATSLWNLPTAIATATVNQVKIEKATLQQQLTAFANAQIEHADEQNKATVETLREGSEEDDDGFFDMLYNGVSSFFGSFITPETKLTDNYCITDDMLYDGLSTYINEGGIQTELNV